MPLCSKTSNIRYWV